MPADDIYTDSYIFWSWQYTKRNETVMNDCQEFYRIVSDLKSVGLVNDSMEIQMQLAQDSFIKKMDEQRYILRNFNDDEHTQLIRAKALAKNISEFAFDYTSILDRSLSSTKVLESIAHNGKLPDQKPFVINSDWQHIVSLICEVTDDTIWKCSGEIEEEDLGKFLLAVDMRKPIDLVMGRLSFMVSVIHCLAHGRTPNGYSCFSCCSENSCGSFKQCEQSRQTALTSYKRYIATRDGISLNFGNPAARAIGLWLWDHVQDHGGKNKRGAVADARRALKEQLGPEIRSLGFGTSSDLVIDRFFSKTDKSIRACKPHSFK